MTLPGGFSPTQALRTVADKANPFDGTDTDYDVFSERSVAGGARSPDNGTYWGQQGTSVSPGWVLGENNGYNYVGGDTGGAAPTGDTGGGGGGYVDPYARWGGEAGYNARRGAFNVNTNNQAGAARQGLTDVGNTYDSKTNTFVDEITGGQDQLNRGFAGNELNLRRSMQNIVRGIQAGLRSGGVALAGVNASDSGAADAMARAYARSGNQQSGEARGQAAEQFEELQRQQGGLNTKRTRGEQDLGTWRDTETGRVRSDFGGKIDALAAQAEAEGLGGVVEKSIVDQVLNEALSRLAGIDQSRQQRLGGVRQWTPDEIMKEAIRLDELGQAGNAFSTTGPTVSYGSNGAPINGAVMGEMPIYVKGKDQGIASIPIQRTKQDQAIV
jgi:hypothetical protein